MARWKCTCSYDGGAYCGWQSQSELLAIQQVISEVLSRVFKMDVHVHGSGRTDAGVHAIEQVFHFDFDWAHGSESLKKAINTQLPQDIKLNSATEVDADFHARYSARSKRYHYRLFQGDADPFRWPYCWSISRQIDLNRIQKSLPLFLGEHDFAAFAANRGEAYESTVREITKAEMYQLDGLVHIAFEANGFMYKMVRSLVGTLVNVGMGRVGPEFVTESLAQKRRTPMVLVAPPNGLFLEKVFY